MASWFYAMMRLLHLKQPLKATVHQPKFLDLHLTVRVREAVIDINDDNFWRCMYVLLRAVYPALRALRFCDSSQPVMDKIYYLSHRTTEALKKSEEDLDSSTLFGSLSMDRSLQHEAEMVFGDDDDDGGGGGSGGSGSGDIILGGSNDDSCESSDDDDDNDDNGMSDGGEYGGYELGKKLLWHWEQRKSKIEHDYAITGWALSIMSDIRDDVNERINSNNGLYQAAIERVVKRLHLPPCPNSDPGIIGLKEGEIVDIFWDEFKAFRNRTQQYSEPRCWATQDAVQGRSHLWHEKYSIPYTKVLGFVACRVTSKLAGIGPAERSWATVKQIKDGKRAHLGSDSTEKRAIIMVSAKMKAAQIRRRNMEQIDAVGPNAMFGDDDINFDQQLEQFGVDTMTLREPVVQRVFHAWVEEWEEEDRRKNDPVAEARLLTKYKNLVFNDPDTGATMSIYDKNMEFWRGRGNGWMVIATSADEGVEDEPFALEVVCSLIAQTPQVEGVKIIRKDDEGTVLEIDED